MKIETADNNFQHVSYNDSSFDELLNHLSNNIDKEGHHLSLFLGLYEPNKKKALDKIASELGREIITIDGDNLASRIESETYKKLDETFANIHQSDVILYFKNGDKLCGAYSSYSHSRVKYATPQERYFLKKVKEFNGLVIVDVQEFTDADKTLRRAAQSVISFTLPNSLLKRFFWHLKHYSFHGFELKTKRPDAYHDIA